MKKIDLRNKRKKRVRHSIKRITDKPRLTVTRTNKYIYAQIIDDSTSKTIAASSSLKLKETGVKAAELVGEDIAKKALKTKTSKIVFDRSGYQYHGKIKALADSARKAGLEF